MNIRQQTEDIESRTLHERAAMAAHTKGRVRPEREGVIRTAYQHDRDRILHSKTFRRLKHKTQVFLSPEGDHYRTRLTHTLEVSQIGRTVARALRLNEDLTEAIALGHDLGHTPFGHAGEAVLNEIHEGGFSHYEQSLRVVEVLEKGGQGLNLTHEVRDGILKHSKGRGLAFPQTGEGMPETLEGQVVRAADIIAYANHDLDDALRARVIKPADLPAELVRVLGASHARRIDSMVKDVIYASIDAGLSDIRMGPEVGGATEGLREFLFKNVYESPLIHSEFLKASKVISELYGYFLENDSPHFRPTGEELARHGRGRLVCDFVAGMTDRYALKLYEEVFIPRPWAEL